MDGRTERPSRYRALHYMQSHGKNAATANALHLEALRCFASSSGLIFLQILYCACSKTAISQLPIKILTSPLDAAIPIDYKKTFNLAIGRCLQAVTLTFDP